MPGEKVRWRTRCESSMKSSARLWRILPIFFDFFGSSLSFSSWRMIFATCLATSCHASSAWSRLGLRLGFGLGRRELPLRLVDFVAVELGHDPVEPAGLQKRVRRLLADPYPGLSVESRSHHIRRIPSQGAGRTLSFYHRLPLLL